MSIIEVKNISKKYGDLQAVKNLSFSVEQGEVFGLLGPNGAGKSTTIKILTSQLYPDNGQTLLFGLEPIKANEKIKEKIGVVFEDQNLYPRLTVEENLMFFARLYGKGKTEVQNVLELVKLDHRKNQEAGKLSRGLKQRLVIARALLPDPEIIFLDEPTSGLDPHVAREIRDIFMQLKKKGKTIFLTTHYMEEADEMCDRVAFINEGTIVALDSPSNHKEKLGLAKIVITTNNNEIPEETAEFPTDSPEAARYIQKLIDNSVKFRISTIKVSLEDVFIKMTGARLE
jgi:ABC-2 type transport system ATP-binding protein